MRRLKARRVKWLAQGHTHRMECKAKAGARAPARGLSLLWKTALLPSTPATVFRRGACLFSRWRQRNCHEPCAHPSLPLSAPDSLGGLGFGAGEAGRSPAAAAGHQHRHTHSQPFRTQARAGGLAGACGRVQRWNHRRKARKYEEKGFSVSLPIRFLLK